MKEIKKFSLDLGGKTIAAEIGLLAGQANGAVTLQCGGTMVLATAVMSKNTREGIDYFPLTVDYEEKYYAAGKISGSRFIKRENRPSEEAILSDRLIDRSIRPRFNQKMRNDVQVVITVLSMDDENDPDILGLNAASIALMISDIPWDGPVSGVRVGQIGDQFILNPTFAERAQSNFDLVVAGTETKINMLEGRIKEVKEETLLEALKFVRTYLQNLIQFQKEITQSLNPQKQEVPLLEPDEELKKTVKGFLEDKIEDAIYTQAKSERQSKLDELKFALDEYLKGLGYVEKLNVAAMICEEEINEIVHQNILKKNKRPDGRKLDELREISSMVGILPRTHGSGLFMRGETQALSILTLGSPADEQTIEGMDINIKKRYMHHYNFPPFSVGETGRMGAPGRREIGHGALAEKAVEPLLPSKEEFPYTIRVVTEILSSNGSSSMASVCGSSLALMDGGVPIKKPVAGIAMGLMIDEKGHYKVLTDLQGPEDHHGDIDFKVAGTADGVTALQMDVKIEGVTVDILKDAFEQAKKARLTILDKMGKVLGEPRPQLSQFAPRVYTIKINPEKIGTVIGSGGKVINEIIAQTGADIDIEDDGSVFITAPKEESAQKAIAWIKNLTREFKAGEIVQGKVSRILDFGAIVDLTPNQDGLLHISELTNYRVNKVEDIVKVGDTVTVKIKRVEPEGKISLSMKEVNNSGKKSF